jgi:hypothetical protein
MTLRQATGSLASFIAAFLLGAIRI